MKPIYKYLIVAVISLLVGLFFSPKKTETITKEVENTEKIEQLTAEIKRLTVELTQSQSQEVVTREVIREIRVDGSKTEIERSSETKTKSEQKSVEIVEVEKIVYVEVEKKAEEKQVVETKITGSDRFGLSLGAAGVLDLETLKPSLQADASYEFWPRISPFIGLQFPLNFGKIEEVQIGIRINL